MRICLVACVGQKLAQEAPAGLLYTSPWFVKARAWAQANSDVWFILSAKHGLVRPMRWIRPYDTGLACMTKRDRGVWAADVSKALRRLVWSGDTVTILAGVRYREGIVETLEEIGARVEVPMAGLGIGQQLKWLGK